MAEHKYAEILRAIADGKQFQYKGTGLYSADWFDYDREELLKDIAEYSPHDEIRIKPEFVLINGIEVPKPLTKLPADGEYVFFPDFCPEATNDCVQAIEVGYFTGLIEELLRFGLLHDSHEKAAAHAKALISFTEQK